MTADAATIIPADAEPEPEKIDPRAAKVPPAEKVKRALEYERRRLGRWKTEHGRYLDATLNGDADAEAKLRKAAHGINESTIRVTALEASLAKAEAHEAERAATAEAARKARDAAAGRALLQENEAELIAIEAEAAKIGERLTRIGERAIKARNLLPSHWADLGNLQAHIGNSFGVLLAQKIEHLGHLAPMATDKTLWEFRYSAAVAERYDAVCHGVHGAERTQPAPEKPCAWEQRPGAPPIEKPTKPPRPFADERERLRAEGDARAKAARIARADTTAENYEPLP